MKLILRSSKKTGDRGGHCVGAGAQEAVNHLRAVTTVSRTPIGLFGNDRVYRISVTQSNKQKSFTLVTFMSPIARAALLFTDSPLDLRSFLINAKTTSPAQKLTVGQHADWRADDLAGWAPATQKGS